MLACAGQQVWCEVLSVSRGDGPLGALALVLSRRTQERFFEEQVRCVCALSQQGGGALQPSA